MPIARCVLTFAALAAAPALAAEPASLCPASSGQPAARLSQVDLMSGPLVDNAVLAPDSSTAQGRETVNTWTIAGNEPVTIVCRYGPNAAAVTKPAPAGAKTCTVRLRSARTAGGLPTNVSCS